MTGKIEIIAHEDHLETRTFVERVSRTDKAAVVCSVFNALGIDLDNPFDVTELLIRAREIRRRGRSEQYKISDELAARLKDQEEGKPGHE